MYLKKRKWNFPFPLGLSGPTSPRASPSLPGPRPSQPASAFPSSLSGGWQVGPTRQVLPLPQATAHAVWPCARFPLSSLRPVQLPKSVFSNYVFGFWKRKIIYSYSKYVFRYYSFATEFVLAIVNRCLSPNGQLPTEGAYANRRFQRTPFQRWSHPLDRAVSISS